MDATTWAEDFTGVTTFFNTGNGYLNEVDSGSGQYTIPPNNVIDSGIRLFDFDGDDRTDVLMRNADGQTLVNGQVAFAVAGAVDHARHAVE